MNVSFFQIKEANQLKAITYERGVEDFTLSCGTGALATAFVYLYRYNFPIKNPKIISVQMPGGNLEVQKGPPPALFSFPKKGF